METRSDLRKTLKFGLNFNQTLRAVTLPSRLETLILGESFETFEGHFPSSLREIAIGQVLLRSYEPL